MNSTEPQSIIHQIIRLEQRIVRNVRKAHLRRRNSRYLRNLNKKNGDLDSTCCETDATISDTERQSTHFVASQQASFAVESSDSLSLLDESAEFTAQQGRCQTISQNYFLSDLMINAQESQVSYVHFYDNESNVTSKIDKRLRQLESLYPQSRFYRIDSNLAPFIAAKLKIRPGKPALVAMMHGALLNKISDFSDDIDDEVNTWVSTVNILQRFQRDSPIRF